MAHWMCITNEKNWNVAKSKRIWGLADRNRKKLESSKVGDYLVFYIKQRRINSKIIRPKIVGIFKVASKPFFDEERIFASLPKKADELYPWRVKIETVTIPKKPLEFKEVVPLLQFIKNKEKWFLYIQTTMRVIPKQDFDLIKSAVSRHKK